MKIGKRKIIIMLALIVCGSVIYELPYLSYIYYDLLLEGLDITNTQMGTLMSVYGTVAMLGYFPGGWAADKISARKLLTFSLVSGGLLGIWFWTLPKSFGVLIFIYAFWGITTSVTFWAALMKATRQLGDSSQQGRLFGILESGRGLLPLLYGFAIVALFNYVGANILGLRTVILTYAIIELLGGVFVWFAIMDNVDDDGEKTGATVKDVVHVMKNKKIWLLALVIFSSYVMYNGFSYFTPYITEIYGASTSLAAFLGIIKTYGLALLGGLVSGVIADKIGSRTKVISYTNIVPVITLALFFFIPKEPGAIIPVIINLVVFGFSIYMVRGIYFAVIDDLKIPMRYSGAAIGFVSFIGFMPESFIYILCGSFLDKYPGIQGYYYIFIFMTVLAVMGLIVAGILYRSLKKEKNIKTEE